MTNRQPRPAPDGTPMRRGTSTRRRSGTNTIGSLAAAPNPIAAQLLTLHGWRDHEPHLGNKAIKIGSHSIFAAGSNYKAQLTGGVLPTFDCYVALDNVSIVSHNKRVLAFPLDDFGGVPEGWYDLLCAEVVSYLRHGYSMCVFCIGGHGRTGTVLASLIALLESESQTPDPIQAIRERYCFRAVETQEQARGIFALRDQSVPDRWMESLMPPKPAFTSYNQKYFAQG